MQDLEITDYHSSLQKIECTGDEMIVTFKNGVDYAVPMSAVVTYMAAQWNADQLNALVGMYSPRPDIVLTSLEAGKVINAAGAKVAKSGWAIAEFTAQLGNVYLFNPGATASDVCVFAEKIDKVETRGIDYAYTYDSKGNPLTAKATYNGATHSYTYTNTYTTQEGGQESLSVVITDDQTKKTVEYLPQTYQTTVGAYQPMVRLNENAELPKDGYCRFVSNFQTSDSIRIAVSYKVASADLTMKVVRSGMVASMCTQLSKINQKVDEAKAAIEVLSKEVSNMSNGLGMVGFCRVNGDVSCDPAADQVYGTKEMIHEIGKHFRLGLAKTNGTVADVKRMAPGRLTLGADGEKHAIDGTEGDVVLVFDDDVYLQKCTQMVNNVELNCMGVSMNAHSWHGHAAKHFKPFAISPHYTVNCKLDGDERSQAHVVWNKTLGNYVLPQKSILTNTFIKNAPTQSVSLIKNAELTQSKNSDITTNRPFMGLYYEFYEIWASLMMIECGTLAVTKPELFGLGTCNYLADKKFWHDESMSGVSMIKVEGEHGTEYVNISDLKGYTCSESTYSIIYSLAGEYSFCTVNMLEGQRFLDGLADAGLINYLGDASALFILSDDGVVTKVDGVNVDTGEGMADYVTYYQARNVPGCEGMESGVMTAVVNTYTKIIFKDGTVNDNGYSVNAAYVKRSIPIYRGKTLPICGMFENLYGITLAVPADKTFSELSYADDFRSIPPLDNFGDSAIIGEWPATIELGLNNRVKRTINKYTAFKQKCNYSCGLFDLIGESASMFSYESACLFPDIYDTLDTRTVACFFVGCSSDPWNGGKASIRSRYNTLKGSRGDVNSASFSVTNINLLI